MTSTTVRFLNGDLVTYPYAGNARDHLINAICETMSSSPIHPLQVALIRDDERKDGDNNILNAVIFPRKRVSLHEFNHILYTKKIDWTALDLEEMTNESVIGHLLSLPVDEIPNRVFANPNNMVVDFLDRSGIFRLDQTEAEIEQWFRDKRGRHILSNPSERIVDVLDKISPELLMEQYRDNQGNANDPLFFQLTALILGHPLVTEEMIATILANNDYMPCIEKEKVEKRTEERTWRYLCDVRHRPEAKSHPEFLTTLTELLCDLQYADCEVVF
jgi:hypothetical protein